MTLIRRRAWLGALLLLSACSSIAPTPAPLPVVFVHGNGDNASLWTTSVWRWESNGWPRDRLFAVDLPNPTARDDDTQPQFGRSSAAENAEALAAEVNRVLTATGAPKVVLVGNSRGGNAIRHYVERLGGAARVAKVVLGGASSHGVWADAAFRPNNEFNGAGPYLTALNAPKGAAGDEVTPGVAWMTLRSDHNDKYAQPDGTWIGAKGKPTNVTFDGPALKGATNLVLPGRDHRETSFHAESFAKTFEFVTGRAPATLDVAPEAQPVLDGLVSGFSAGGPTNLPLAGATVEVFAVDPATGARRGPAVHRKTVGEDGRWGPFTASNDAFYEFVLAAPGYATTHVYRSPFPRGSRLVHLRPERLQPADQGAKAVVVMSRPRGYFGLPRDRVVLDGRSPAPGIPPGVAGVSASRLGLLVGLGRPVVGEYESGTIRERIVAATWPAAGQHVSVIELTW